MKNRKFLFISVLGMLGAGINISTVKAATIFNLGTIYDLKLPNAFITDTETISVEGSLIYTGPFGEITVDTLNSNSTWDINFSGINNSDGDFLNFRLTNQDSTWNSPRVTIIAQPDLLTLDLNTPIPSTATFIELVGTQVSNQESIFAFGQVFSDFPPITETNIFIQLSEALGSDSANLEPDSSLQFSGQPIVEATTSEPKSLLALLTLSILSLILRFKFRFNVKHKKSYKIKA